MPKKVWNIDELRGMHLHVTHKINGIAAARGLIPRLRIKGPKHTLKQEVKWWLPDGHIIYLLLSVITLKARGD